MRRPLATVRRVDADVVFLLGLAAIEASRKPGLDDAAREALFDDAIVGLHEMLVERSYLVRVRLELAHAFFYKGEDGIARDHFRAGAGGGRAARGRDQRADPSPADPGALTPGALALLAPRGSGRSRSQR